MTNPKHRWCLKLRQKHTNELRHRRRVYKTQLAHRAGLPRASQMVVLRDGATGSWHLAEKLFPGAIPMVDDDQEHEPVWDVARAAFAADPQARPCRANAVIGVLS